MKETERLLEVIHKLRQQCPWDKKQTHRSLMPYLIEEAYETLDAIESEDAPSLKEELGDLLLQITLHAEIASEKDSEFNFEAVAKGLADKMIHRHPHVFQSVKVNDEKEHLQNWAKLKDQEKKRESLLDGIPRNLPALQLSQKYGARAARVGFDWDRIEGVMDKVHEELEELKIEISNKKVDKSAMEMELGDVLFSLANLARHLKLDSEQALRRSASKFAKRFSKLEKKVAEKGKAFSDFSLDELEEHWQSIKA